ncbi:AzlC family ABC transporter permease [Streptomyces sp. NPDC050164]|uniref:AzlC family ABC transporter permease n=1 Tax=Streptomyces sp. NPDC050164 TaxID=3365605 RepID=UPI00378F6BAC
MSSAVRLDRLHGPPFSLLREDVVGLRSRNTLVHRPDGPLLRRAAGHDPAAPPASIAVAAFLVQARHVLYALSFPLHRVRGRLTRTYSTFALTDEAYALTATEPGRQRDRRGLLGSLIPDGVQHRVRPPSRGPPTTTAPRPAAHTTSPFTSTA